MNSDNKKEIDKIEGINAVMIIEVLGKPPEHLTETLNEIVKKIDEEKGVSVLSKKINEPILIKDQKEFYTSFAEIEVGVKEIFNLGILMFKYMPAHIEVISPELIALTNNGWNEILNEITRRLHGYDEIARIVQAEKNILEKKLRELMPDKKEEKGSEQVQASSASMRSVEREKKSAVVEAGKEMEKAAAQKIKHQTKVKSPKQEKNERVGYNKSSRGH